MDRQGGKMPHKKKVSDDVLVDSYKRTGNVWKTAKEVGMSGQQVHVRLQRLNTIKDNHWSEEEDKKLNDIYKLTNGDIEKAVALLGRTKASVACRANELKITNKCRKLRDETKMKLSKLAKERLKEKPHPRGMKDKKHTNITKKVISEKSKEMWKDPNNKLNSEEHRQKLSDRMTQNRINMPITNVYSRCKRGYYDINGKKMFFRSAWEAMYANYLVKLLQLKAILNWEYEPKIFWFENIKRGIRSYTPDFRVTWQDGTVEYHEVKGWMDDKSKTKIKRMAKYYPEVKLIVIDQKQFNALKRQGLLKKIYLQDAH